ncbi:DUF3501 family protein [Candidatus Venteria ishoeyi]|uniref:DUF3501 domain-containing protein n=1 Tax=Candidatus Venteria ishoeyi TaxID=1899563 RepID=A0A1H6F8I0_9GAMM|nr:DUF3501 family protein [Candidatus Venteria ishoeyi]MDM8547805.1 DUF3501 family protein [Candidatus Venteria ishoeyi]SEH05883.1 Uncharacterised protein [Candidatus Venteria ishoeyi]
MHKLTREDLYSLEQYAEARNAFRAKVMAHKKNRQIALGDHATLYFEDRLTMQYQIQEMLRVERIFEAAAINEELDTYNPLIPDGKNLKATFMLEYQDVEERQQALMQLKGIEEQVWLCVAGYDKVYPIANEDLERTNEEKTSAVHFMRLELNDDMIAALKAGADLSMGIAHPAYNVAVESLPEANKAALLADLQ